MAEDYDTAREIIELPGRMTIATWSKAAQHLKLKSSIPEEFRLHRFISNQENVARLLDHTMGTVPPEAIDEFFVYGSPDDCIEGIERYLKAGG